MAQTNPEKGGAADQPHRTRRGRRRAPASPVRVRTKRLDQVDESKLALAYWLLAKKIVEDESDRRPLTQAELDRVAAKLDQPMSVDESDDRATGEAA